MPKKLEFKTFTDLTQDNQYAVAGYLFGALVLFMIGISGISSGMNGIILALLGIPPGAWCGYKGYKILIDPKNEKKCNAAYWRVTEMVGFDPDDYVSDLGTTLCEAQKKAEYNGNYTGFFCTSNSETEDTIDAYYFETKKLSIKASGTSNVFTAKSTVKVTDPPGSFTIKFTSATRDTVVIQASNLTRIDETRSATVVVNPPSSSPSPSPSTTTTVSIQDLKNGYTVPGVPFDTLTTFDVTMYSTTRDGLAVTKSLRINYSSSS